MKTFCFFVAAVIAFANVAHGQVLINVTVERGTIQAGNAQSCAASDDERLEIQQGIAPQLGDPEVITRFFGWAPPSSFVVLAGIECSANTPGLGGKIFALNFTTDTYDHIGTIDVPFNNDQVYVFAIGAQHHGDVGELDTRVEVKDGPFTILNPWRFKVDHAFWVTAK